MFAALSVNDPEAQGAPGSEVLMRVADVEGGDMWGAVSGGGAHSLGSFLGSVECSSTTARKLALTVGGPVPLVQQVAMAVPKELKCSHKLR